MKIGDSRVQKARLKKKRFYRLQRYDIPGEGKIFRLIPAFPEDGNGHLGTFRPSDFIDRLHSRHVLGRLIFYLDDNIFGLQSCFMSRCSLNGRDDGDNVIDDGDFDTDTGKASSGFILQHSKALRSQVGRMRVKREQHTIDCPIDYFLGINLGNIVVLEDGQNISEQFQLFIGFFSFLLSDLS